MVPFGSKTAGGLWKTAGAIRSVATATNKMTNNRRCLLCIGAFKLLIIIPGLVTMVYFKRHTSREQNTCIHHHRHCCRRARIPDPERLHLQRKTGSSGEGREERRIYHRRPARETSGRRCRNGSRARKRLNDNGTPVWEPSEA